MNGDIRQCIICKNDFTVDQHGNTGFVCANCRNKLQRKRLKFKAIQYKGGKCERCSYNKCQEALEFHHLDSSKKDFNITSTQKSWDKVKKELDKCSLLCSNCHREEHLSKYYSYEELEKIYNDYINENRKYGYRTKRPDKKIFDEDMKKFNNDKNKVADKYSVSVKTINRWIRLYNMGR